MKSKFITRNVFVYLIVVSLLLGMTIGYASFNEELIIETKAYLIDDDIDEMISLDTKYRYTNDSTDRGVIVGLNIEDESSSVIEFKIKNNSEHTMTYVGNKALYTSTYYPIINGILPGDYLLPNEEKTIYIKDAFNSSLNNISIEFEFLKDAYYIEPPRIVTNLTDVIRYDDNSISIDIMNLYDSSIELELYFNDDDLNISLEKKILVLNRGESKNFQIGLEGTMLDEEIDTIIYARVLSNTSEEDIYLVDNITITKDV